MTRQLTAEAQPHTEAARAVHVTNQWPPLNMGIDEIAAHLGIGRTLFKKMVEDGRMPKGFKLGSEANASGRGTRTLWYRPAVEAAMRDLVLADGDEDLAA